MTENPAGHSQILHASCVAAGSKGLLIIGPSGAGKSGLALQLIGLGAQLVSDDRTVLSVEDNQLTARAPATLRGMIEARGLGILNAPFAEQAQVHLVVDLAHTETERLPPARHINLLGVTCDLVHLSKSGHFPAALMCYLLHGRFA